MLKFFKRLERTRNFVLLLFAIVMVVSLIVFYAPTTDTVQANLARSQEAVAEVGSETITLGEVATQKQALGTRAAMLPAKTMLNGMISSRIIRLEADRLGLRASDAEVARQIREEFKPTDGATFDQKRYEQSVTDQFGSVQSYEAAVRDYLSEQKLRAFLTSGVTVSEEEVLDEYRRTNTKFDLSYVPVSVADLAQTITPTEDELKNYFDQNKKNYYISSPQKKIRYVFLNTNKIGEKLNIPEADLRAEYDKLPEDKRQAGIQGQQIVLRIAKPEFKDQVLKKASEIVQGARKDGNMISEEAFAELAKGQSEDPRTASNGGRIPGLIKENPNKPDDPYQQLLSMKPGEITEPIEYAGSYFILRRGEPVAKTFEDAKNELEVSLRNRRAYAAAAELAQKVTEDLKQTKDVQQTAQKFAAEANMSPSEMVRETGFVKPNDDVEFIGNSPQFEEGIKPLENINDIGDRIPIQNGFAIPMLVDKRDPRDAEFAEVKDQVAETVKLQLARARVEEIAKQIAAGAASAGDLSNAAQSRNLKALEQKSFILGSPLGQGPTASTNEQLQDAIFNLKQGEVTKQPIKVGDNWYIVGVTRREEANMDDFAKQRDQLVQQKLQQKRGQVFADYLASVRQRMEAGGEIKIYEEPLAKLDEATEGDQPTIPGLPPGFPPPGQP